MRAIRLVYHKTPPKRKKGELCKSSKYSYSTFTSFWTIAE